MVNPDSPHPNPPPRAATLAAWIGGSVLFASHLFWAPEAGERLLSSGLPVELAWRIAWLGLAWGYLLFFCAWIWREDDP